MLSTLPSWNNISHVLCFSSKSFWRIHTIYEYAFSPMIGATTRFFWSAKEGRYSTWGSRMTWSVTHRLKRAVIFFLQSRNGGKICYYVGSFLPKAGFYELEGLAPLPFLRVKTFGPFLGVSQIMGPWWLVELDLEILLTNSLVQGAASINLKNEGKCGFFRK